MPPHSSFDRFREWLFRPLAVNDRAPTTGQRSIEDMRHIPVSDSGSSTPATNEPQPQPEKTIASLPLDVFGIAEALPEPEVAGAAIPDTARECQWCDAVVPPDAELCPVCGSRVQGDPAQSIPGLTELTQSQLEELDRPLRLPRGATGEVLVDVLIDELVADNDDE